MRFTSPRQKGLSSPWGEQRPFGRALRRRPLAVSGFFDWGGMSTGSSIGAVSGLFVEKGLTVGCFFGGLVRCPARYPGRT